MVVSSIVHNALQTYTRFEPDGDTCTMFKKKIQMKLFRVNWRAPTGYEGHGEWFEDEKHVKDCVEMANKDWPSIEHWVESTEEAQIKTQHNAILSTIFSFDFLLDYIHPHLDVFDPGR